MAQTSLTLFGPFDPPNTSKAT